ncbi:MAG: 16S rRNA (uracil(1498)-N(3))-methyltransferase [Albidovulum sp.]|uniref:16S rRNA (uracil(1498)-N(3))-methyltransferase n=1 Tax=Albidovulum sp. TaxID=1872424 RepID=UPI00132BD55E|nr:16S rRNA (uracil(1498)-N(3))-methyltransferase [Defluviimonas sp.]KAB2883233.1 MAG: 16S rRNA (uracil(1498)-N(3))-methyltransferase [Defluviimonas sp.]
MVQAKIRLCVDQPLGPGQSVVLAEAQAHYLFGVMREGPGSRVLVFNGRDGEWLAEVAEAGKRKGTLRCLERTRVQDRPADLWLLFAPVKKVRTDFIVEKAVELGVARLLPVTTDYTNAERFRRDKAEAHVREAAEQCGAMALPSVAEPATLGKVLAAWDAGRQLLWADEAAAGAGSPRDVLAALAPGPSAILIGPEGGFSPAEREWLRALPFVTSVALGPRILRAETAAVALVAIWQAHLGDWTPA